MMPRLHSHPDTAAAASLAGWLLLLLMIVPAGCRRVDRVAYARFANFTSDQGWPAEFTPEFHPWPVDSMVDTQGYDLAVVVRHSPKCALATLPVVVEMSDSTGAVTTDTVSVELRSSRHRDLFGITHSADTLLRRAHPTPGWTVTLASPLNQSDTRGILSIGITLTAAGSPECRP